MGVSVSWCLFGLPQQQKIKAHQISPEAKTVVLRGISAPYIHMYVQI